MNGLHESDPHRQRCINSALWAAWGDALGFISELTDAAGLRRRLGSDNLQEPVAWRRRVGGRSGVTVELPAGCYSDDTQLRLAVGRSINNRGFDPETFAKIELPTWTNYALGGGRATKAAASNLTSQSVPWFANFFAGWISAGGNGAAMRVQPHLWAAKRPADYGPHIVDLLVDASVTHGHPRALMGAALSGFALGHTLQYGEVPMLEHWPELLHHAIKARQVFTQHAELSAVWEPHWNRESDQDFDTVWKVTAAEIEALMHAATECIADRTRREDADATVGRLADALNLRPAETRGSGTSTVVAALAIAYAYREQPTVGVRAAARAIGTDTDTIASMTGAILGAQVDSLPPTPVLDAEYIASEARRLATLANANSNDTVSGGFTYPDLLHWVPATTQADAVQLVGGQLELVGLSPVKISAIAGQSGGFVWSWGRLTFGQTVLIKHRQHLSEKVEEQLTTQQAPMHEEVWTVPAEIVPSNRLRDRSPGGSFRSPQEEISQPTSPSWGSSAPTGLDVDQVIAWVVGQQLSDRAIGYAVRRLSEQGSVEQLIAFTTAIRREVGQMRRDGRARTND
jgi:ADP-ribosylglycohydrolase